MRGMKRDMKKSLKALLLAPVAALALAGCSVADPDTSQAVLHYSGGAFESQAFLNCIDPGTRSVDGPSDFHFYYPAGLRSYTFSDREGADAPPIKVSTKDQTELIVRGTITFQLNTDCSPAKVNGRDYAGGVFQAFHDTIGRAKVAYAENGGDAQPAGWNAVLNTYIGGPAERAMDNNGISFPALSLYSDEKAKGDWVSRVEASLPRLIEEQAGGPFFTIKNIQLDKPDVDDALKAELNNKQAAKLRAETAATDLQAARDFPGGLAGLRADQQQQAINKAISEGKVNPLIVPQGSPIIAGGTR